MTLLLWILCVVGYWLVGPIVYGSYMRISPPQTEDAQNARAAFATFWPITLTAVGMFWAFVAVLTLVFALPAWSGGKVGRWLVATVIDAPSRHRAAVEARRKKRDREAAEGVRERPYR
jgi:hypothetical protein